ncbi:MAG: hypothetical protein RBT71_10585 [Flavobacteriales bacterium]|jgi:sugar lactone lactonase YvrE|nr:hypothetical protein [Flavobacteriales bacterium]
MRPALLLVLLPFAAHAQYQGPESVEYDPAGDRYFVSNTGSATIKQLAQDGTVTDFVAGLPAAPYGLEIMGDVLYACMGGGVRGFSLATGAQVAQVALNAGFANGITTDGSHLYVTDFHNSQRRIFKVDPVAGTFTVLAAGLPGQPNGIVYRAATNELLVGFWGAGAAVRSYNATTGALTGTVVTNVGSIDGITLDCAGRVLIASWSPARITRFEWDVPAPVFEDLGVAGLSNPADIDHDAVNDRLCIPNSGNHTVTLHALGCAPTGVPGAGAADDGLRVMPNPAHDRITVLPGFSRAQPYLLLNTRGSVIGGGTLSPGAALDIGPLAPGTYTMHFTRDGRRARFVKE